MNIFLSCTHKTRNSPTIYYNKKKPINRKQAVICGNSSKEHVPICRFGKKKSSFYALARVVSYMHIGGLHAYHPAANIVFYEFFSPVFERRVPYTFALFRSLIKHHS